MVYSPAVPVIRDDEDRLLAVPYSLSMLSLVVVHGHRSLVLDAWGCGVFKNDSADVARWFQVHLCGMLGTI